MKSLFITAGMLIGTSLIGAAKPSVYLAEVNLNATTNEVEVVIKSKDPVTVSLITPTYIRQPEYYLHEITTKPDHMAGACDGECRQTISFDADDHMGTLGIEVQYGSKQVQLGIEKLN